MDCKMSWCLNKYFWQGKHYLLEVTRLSLHLPSSQSWSLLRVSRLLDRELRLRFPPAHTHTQSPTFTIVFCISLMYPHHSRYNFKYPEQNNLKIYRTCTGKTSDPVHIRVRAWRASGFWRARLRTSVVPAAGGPANSASTSPTLIRRGPSPASPRHHSLQLWRPEAKCGKENLVSTPSVEVGVWLCHFKHRYWAFAYL